MSPCLYQPCVCSGTLKIEALLETGSDRPVLPPQVSVFLSLKWWALLCAAFGASGFWFSM